MITPQKMSSASDPNAIVSACLTGVSCRYNGRDALDNELMAMLKLFNIIPVCPEVLGGLETPRPPAQINRGDGFAVLSASASVITEAGKDVTSHFFKGADQAMKITRTHNIKSVYLKDGSPSCGVNYIKRKSARVDGCGVFCAMLRQQGYVPIGR